MRGSTKIVTLRLVPPAQAHRIGARRHRHRLHAFIGSEGAALPRQHRRNVLLQRHFDGGRFDVHFQGLGRGGKGSAEEEREERPRGPMQRRPPWRTHSCVPRRVSTRRFCAVGQRASARVPTLHAGVRAPRLHNRPFHCASSMRPATGAASAPPLRACTITVTTAPSEKPANHARYTPAGVRTVPVLPATFSPVTDRKSTRLNSSHLGISYAVFCLK